MATELPANAQLIERFISDNNFTNGVELGVREADLSRYLLNKFDNLHLVVVDLWSQGGFSDKMNDIYNHSENERISRERLEPYKERVEILRMATHLAADNYDDKSFDFVYIDSSHVGDCVTREINAWYPKLKDTGIMCGHDYCDAWGGTYKEAIDKFCGNNLVDMGNVDDSSWFCWKKYINIGE